jgi:TRAP-type C4-dicarboxylate transport system permease small subunit
MSGVDRFVRRLSQGLNWVAMGAITAMMFLVSADVILRPLGFPIVGSYEISGLLGGVAISFALAKVTREKGHVAVELLMARTRPSVRFAVNKITQAFTLVLFALISWQSAKYGRVLWESGEVSMTIGLPFYPVVYGIALTSAVVTLVIALDLFRPKT